MRGVERHPQRDNPVFERDFQEQTDSVYDCCCVHLKLVANFLFNRFHILDEMGFPFAEGFRIIPAVFSTTEISACRDQYESLSFIHFVG
jgi:hypothetical protein